MAIIFDPKKSAANAAARGLSFEQVEDFDWSSALVVEDVRFTYPERRFQALGDLGGVLHMVVFAVIGDDIRVISLRRASRKERASYAEKA